MKILDYIGMAPEPTAKPLRYVMYVRKFPRTPRRKLNHYQTKSRHVKNMRAYTDVKMYDILASKRSVQAEKNNK